MHSMVGAFSPYAVKRRRAELVRGYCYRFFQCSFPCGIVMLILSILFIIAGASQLIYINHMNGCNLTTIDSIETTENIPRKPLISFKCNRQTVRVLGITFVVTGSVLFFIGLLVTKYSRSGEENNVIRTTTSSLLANTSRNSNSQSHHPSTHYYHGRSSSIQDPNNIVISVR